METSHREIYTLKSVSKCNSFPKNFIDLRFKKILDKLFVKNKVILTVPKLQLVCLLPYTGKSSFDSKARLRCTIEKNLPFCKINIFQNFIG